MEDMNLPTAGAVDSAAEDAGTQCAAPDGTSGEPTVDVTDAKAADGVAAEPYNADAAAKPTELPSPKTARLTYSSYAEMRPSPSSKYAPMSLGGYILMLAVAMIPAVGFIASAIVACSSKKLARQRLALAVVLITTVLTVILGALAFVAIYVFDVDVLGEVVSFFKR